MNFLISHNYTTPYRLAAVTVLAAVLLLLSPGEILHAQSGEIEFSSVLPVGSVYLSRYNLRTRVSGRYAGLRYTEITGDLEQSRGGNYDASYWQLSQTNKDLRSVIAPVDRVQRHRFTSEELNYISKPLSGSYPDHLYFFPEYRNFPLLPSETLYSIVGPGIPEVGSSWESFAYRLVDPEGDGEFTPVQILVRYFYRGTGEYLGERVHFIDADFALRSDGRLTGFVVQGRNEVRITVFPGYDPRIFMNNSLVEEYRLADGTSVRFEGFGLTWIKSPRPVYRDTQFLRSISSLPGSNTVNPSSDTAAEPSSNPRDAEDGDQLPAELPEAITSESGNIEFAMADLGLNIRIPDIQFRPDSAELLPGENSRMDVLAGILREAGERRFLVVGHTADVGNPDGQRALSLRRAQAVAELLSARGIPPGSIRYEGRGGTEPLGDNSSEEGRAQNRRVEVIILDY